MKQLMVAWSPLYAHPVPVGHKFPMEKYDLLPRQLMHEGILDPENFFEPGLLSNELAESAHDSGYLENLKQLSLSLKDQRKTGFVHDERLIEREYCIAEGTRMAVDFAYSNGVAGNIAGGTHHAFSNRGEGFCLLNDQTIGAKYALSNRLAASVLIVDLDVHQGNGTAEIFKNEPRVFTFSMHGKDNYPLKKEHSDRDVEVETGCNGLQYLSLLESELQALLDQKKSFDFVFYQAGVDVLASDRLGHLNLTLNDVKERDALVLNFVKQLNVPLVFCMGGGYSPKINQILDAHVGLFRLIQNGFF